MYAAASDKLSLRRCIMWMIVVDPRIVQVFVDEDERTDNRHRGDG